MPRNALFLTLALGLVTVVAPPARATEGGGGTAPSTIYAGVSWYRGIWRGTSSSCTWEPFADSGVVAKVENGIRYELYRKRCPGPTQELVWIPDIDHKRLSFSATAYLDRVLPDPAATFAPPASKGVVNIGMWFWLSPSIWSSVSVTAWIPTTSGTRWATTTAKPVRLLFEPGDGGFGTGALSCTGPGTKWTAGIGDEASSPSGCQYTYQHSSVMAANGASFPGRVTIVWDVSWRGSSGGGGYSGQLRTSRSYAITVREIQAVVTT